MQINFKETFCLELARLALINKNENAACLDSCSAVFQFQYQAHHI